jgi:hypothetical protein
MIPHVNGENLAVRYGELQKSRREQTIDPTTGRTYTQSGLAGAASAIANETYTRSMVASIEAGKVVTPEARYINAVVRLGLMTGIEAVQAIGYEIEAPSLRDDERDLLAAYRRLRDDPHMQATALAVVRAMPAGRHPGAGTSPRRRQAV